MRDLSVLEQHQLKLGYNKDVIKKCFTLLEIRKPDSDFSRVLDSYFPCPETKLAEAISS